MEGSEVSMDNIQWMLPVNEGTRDKEPVIYKNAKYHCFVTNEDKKPGIQRNGKSLCGNHLQAMDYYETIESGQMLMFPAVACRACLDRWKRKFHIGL